MGDALDLVRPAAISEPKLIPPLRFGIVDGGIYRGCYPKPLFTNFLQRLQLKTIVSVIPDPLESPESLGLGPEIEFVHIAGASEKSKSKKKRGVPINHELVSGVIDILRDPSKQPVYLHCINGRQTTSLIVACMRCSQGWSLNSAFQEFSRFCDYDRQDMVFVQKYKEEEER